MMTFQKIMIHIDPESAFVEGVVLLEDAGVIKLVSYADLNVNALESVATHNNPK